MCGIVGTFAREPNRVVDTRLLSRMNGLIAHRGPDDAGIYKDGSLGLGHRRLSVIDLALGHQPMSDPARGRVIVYNGEIYNYRELRKELPAGVELETNSDTEVLLKLASFDVLDWLEKLNGMFAFAIWDERSRRLLLARDRLGIKPLYYAFLGDELVFASEIKALLLHPRIAREVNVERIPEFLAFRTISGPETLFKGVYELPPGHVMGISQDDFTPRIRRFWSEGSSKSIADYTDPTLSFEDQFERLLTEAVRYRLISDVPVGSYNSGGVDSSLVSSIMRSLTEGELHTFSVGFEESSYDERRYAQVVADRLGTHHHTLVVSEAQYVDSLEETLLHLEGPINHAHTVQLLLLSRYAREHVTVALTGEGSDELFGGYPRLHIPLLSRYLRHMPGVISGAVLRLAQATSQRRIVKLVENSHDVRKSVLESSRHVPAADFRLFFPETSAFSAREQAYDRAAHRGRSFLNNVLYFDQQTYLPSLLTRLDKASMASALECRVPFLDFRLVEWSYLLPDRFKVRVGRDNKRIVKKVAERWLPKEIVYREKVGFGTPVGPWLRNPSGLGRYLDLLTDDVSRERGYFDPRAVERVIREHSKGERDHAEVLWGLMNLELWCRTFIDQVTSTSRVSAAGTGYRVGAAAAAAVASR